jgi:hypothetical protein
MVSKMVSKVMVSPHGFAHDIPPAEMHALGCGAE